MPGMRVPSKGGCAGLGNLLVTKKKKQSGEIFPTTLVHQNLLVTKQSRKIFPTTTLHQRNPQIASGGKKKEKKKSREIFLTMPVNQRSPQLALLRNLSNHDTKEVLNLQSCKIFLTTSVLPCQLHDLKNSSEM